MFRAIQKKEGFTLVELLIVVAIIGILAAIAIPQMSVYRARAFCSSVQADLSNWAKAQEAYYVDNQTYLNSTDPAQAPGFKATTNVTITPTAATAQMFSATAQHPSCLNADGTTVRTYTYNSTTGQLTNDGP